MMVLWLPAMLLAQGNQEFRATWVVDYQWMSSGTIEANKARTRQILDNHKAANMNAVIWQVRRFGNVYYPSSYEPFGSAAGFKPPGYDPLAYAIEEAHKRGLEFHAWMNVFETRNLYQGSPGAEHPEWICRDQDGHIMPAEVAWLSPGLPEVREYLVNVAMEIVRNYDIDGLHLDFVRWNEHTSSQQSVQLAKRAQELGLPDGVITEEQLMELQQNAAGRFLYDVQHPYNAGVPAGFGSWEEWWRWSVTEFVRTLHDSIQAVKPWVRLSPAALGRYNWGGWNGYNIVYQDAALWFNEGYIEQIMGMHYHWTRPDEFLSVLINGCPQCWSQWIQPGIQAGRLYTVGPPSYILAERKLWHNHESIVSAVRTVQWVDGFQFFSYQSWADENYWQRAAETLFPQKAKIRSITPGKPAFGAPTLQLTRVDSLTYRIEVQSPSDATQPHWFAVYRSEDAQPDPAEDEILTLYFGAGPFEYVDRFDGTQDFNGQYTYFATALDRYRHESDPSNAETSTVIPSFAPVVVETVPAEGDTVPVDVAIVVRFSKTMDTTATSAAIDLQPPAPGLDIGWSADAHQMTLIPTAALSYDTEYTLTIGSGAKDINGRAIDGNGDGVEGDAFVLRFHTEIEDVSGPVVVETYPPMDGSAMQVDVATVMSLFFNEPVNFASVSADRLQLLAGGAPVDFGYHITNLAGRSLLSVQATRMLDPNTDHQLRLTGSVLDTLGNAQEQDLTVAFRTSSKMYSEIRNIDTFSSTRNWWQPYQSGSTVGTIRSGTSFGLSGEVYLPAALRDSKGPRPFSTSGTRPPAIT
ncbi:MAG: family 10 glycosylhydrolase [candidate division KSB1 bacterium]|nr:family 10 glycosylhydrolase [candidate division KSB1 bacterium]